MKKIHVASAALLLMTVIPVLAGCDGTISSPPVSSVEEIPVASLSLTAERTYVKVGESLKLSVSVFPANATDKEVRFSTDASCFSVSDEGTITGLSIGEGTVKAVSRNGKEAELTIRVVAAGEHSYLDIEAYGEVLSSTPYALDDISAQGKYGLSDGTDVGVHAEDIRELYGIKSDSEFDASAVLMAEDITLQQVRTYFPDAAEINDYYRIQTAIYLAKELNESGKEAKLKLPARTMMVDASLSASSYAFLIEGMNGLYIEGDDTVICVSVSGVSWKGYLRILNSQAVYLFGVTLKLAVPSAFTGSLVSADTEQKTVTLSVPEEFNDLMALVKVHHPAVRSWVEFDASGNAPLQNGNFLVDAFSSYTVEGNEEDGYSVTVQFQNAITRSRNGTLVSVSFSQYDAAGMTITDCKDVFIENCTMNHASGMALTASGTENLYINRFSLKKEEGSSLLMSATADAMHFNSMHGEVKVTNSLIEYSHDDALNIKHGYFYKLTDAEGGSTRSMTVTRLTGAVEEPEPGDRIAVYDESTFESYNPSSGYYTIETVTPVTNGYRFTVLERMSNVGTWGNARVVFLSDTPAFEFSNNIVRNKRNRGVLVQVPGAVISNNTFMNIGHGSLQAATSMDVYNETTLPQDLIIRNNKFINNCYIKPEPLYGDISVFAISSNATVAPAGTLRNITIENNFIAKNGNAAISLRGVGASSVKDNLFYECSRTQPSGDSFNCLFHMYNCDEIHLEGNYNHYTLENNLSGIILQGKTSQDMIDLSDSNTNIGFQRNEDAGPEVTVPKATGTITVDGDLSDWDDSLLDIALDGCSDAEGTARTAAELADHFAVRKLKMTYDDAGIYLAFDIFDNELSVKTVNDFWLGDCVEVFMSSITDMPNADLQVYKDEGGVLQAAFAPGWTSEGYCTLSSVRTNSEYLARKNLIDAAVIVTDDGYRGEVLIPFAFAPEFYTAVTEGHAIDMAVVVADCERTNLSLKRIQIGNVPHFVEDYKTKTARMPQYYFK